MTEDVHPVDAGRLRHEVKSKYREVAEGSHRRLPLPHRPRPRAAGSVTHRRHWNSCPSGLSRPLPGSANPFHWDRPQPGERVVDLGSGAGMDAFLAALWVGPDGRVIGVDMTPEMLTRSPRERADQLDLENVEFREGHVEAAARGGRLGRRGHLQRGHQPLPRQGRRLPGGPPGPAARRARAHSPTSASSACTRRAPCATSTCGPGESPVPCRAQDGRRSSKARASIEWSTAHRSTPSPAPAGRPAPASSAPRAIPSGPESRRRLLPAREGWRTVPAMWRPP